MVLFPGSLNTVKGAHDFYSIREEWEAQHTTIYPISPCRQPYPHCPFGQQSLPVTLLLPSPFLKENPNPSFTLEAQKKRNLKENIGNKEKGRGRHYWHDLQSSSSGERNKVLLKVGKCHGLLLSWLLDFGNTNKRLYP